MAVKIVWDKVPAETKEALEPHLRRWMPLLPTWCQEFAIEWQPMNDSRMAVRVNYRNRSAVLILTPLWLSDSPEERANSLRHELVHVLLTPLMDAVGSIIDSNTEKNTPARKMADEMYNLALESSVEDAARRIDRLVAEATRRSPQGPGRVPGQESVAEVG